MFLDEEIQLKQQLKEELREELKEDIKDIKFKLNMIVSILVDNNLIAIEVKDIDDLIFNEDD